MPWSANDYPVSWKNLDDDVREKAVEIGNALLAQGIEEPRAIPIALSQARRTLGVDEPSGGRNQWVSPHDDGWAVHAEGAERASRVFDTKKEAVDHAVALAKKHDATVTVQRSDGTIQDRQSFRNRLG